MFKNLVCLFSVNNDKKKNFVRKFVSSGNIVFLLEFECPALCPGVAPAIHRPQKSLPQRSPFGRGSPHVGRFQAEVGELRAKFGPTILPFRIGPDLAKFVPSSANSRMSLDFGSMLEGVNRICADFGCICPSCCAGFRPSLATCCWTLAGACRFRQVWANRRLIWTCARPGPAQMEKLRPKKAKLAELWPALANTGQIWPKSSGRRKGDVRKTVQAMSQLESTARCGGAQCGNVVRVFLRAPTLRALGTVVCASEQPIEDRFCANLGRL